MSKHRFASIPPEILSFHLLDRLSREDLVSLGCVLTLPATQEIYERAFKDDNTYFHHYDGKMFRERAQARLYFSGQLEEDPPMTDNKGGYFESLSEDSFDDNRMFRFLKVPAIDGPILQVSPGNVTLQMMSNKGNIYYMFSGRPKGDEAALGTRFEVYNETSAHDFIEGSKEFLEKSFVVKALGRQPMRETDAHVARFAKERKRLKGLGIQLNDHPAPSHFLSMCSSYSQFLALDEEGLIWNWCPLNNGRQGVPMVLGRLDKVSKLKMGFDSACSAIVEGIGIVIWNTRQHATCWNNGYPTNDGYISSSTVEIIPDTREGIVDYVILHSVLIYLKTDGTLTAVNYATMWEAIVHEEKEQDRQDPENWPVDVEVDGYEWNEYFQESEEIVFDVDKDIRPLVKFNAYAKEEGVRFVRLNGQDVSGGSYKQAWQCDTDAECYGGTSFAVLCDDGSVVFGNTSNLEDIIDGPFSVEGLEELDIASISLGVTHHLALTQQGEVYSWGEDAGGSLGAGRLKDALKMEGAEGKREDKDSPYLTLTRPTKIDLPGKAYGIFAGMQYSAILVY